MVEGGYVGIFAQSILEEGDPTLTCSSASNQTLCNAASSPEM